MYRATLYLLMIITITTGCRTRMPDPEPKNLVPFTHALRQKYRLNDTALMNLQYYLAGDMVLRRELNSDEATVTPGHRIRIINDRKIEEVWFRRLTPGVAVGVRDEALGISFERGGHLTFGSAENSRERHEGKYMLYAKEWTRENQARLPYRGREYVTYGPSESFYVLIDVKELKKFKKESRTVRGRTLDTQ